jgi:hypothetical protein
MPRPFKELLACLKRVFHADSDPEQDSDIAEGVRAIEVAWVPENGGSFGRASALLAVRGAAGWQVFYNYGRVRDAAPHYDTVSFKKGAWLTAGGAKFLQIDYVHTESTRDNLSPEDLKGLKEELFAYTNKEEKHRLYFAVEGSSLPTLKHDLQISCQHSWDLDDADSLKGLPASVRQRIQQKVRAARSASRADARLGPDGKLNGMELREGSDERCGRAVPIGSADATLDADTQKGPRRGSSH